MSLFGKKKKNSADEKPKQTEQSKAEDVVTDGQLIAVISAAIAAFEEKAVSSDLVVRKVSRRRGRSTVWGDAGINDCMRSRI